MGDVAALTLLDPAPHAGEAYHLTGERAWSFEEVAGLLAAELERPVRYAPVSALRYARHLHGQGLPAAQIAVQTILHLGLRRGDAAAVDPTLGRLLGRAPTDLPTFMREHRSAWEDGPGNALPGRPSERRSRATTTTDKVGRVQRPGGRMRIHHAVVVTAMAGALTLGAPAGPAAAATRGEANAKARAAANHYTNTRFGIGFNVPGGAGYWSARCSRVGSH